MDEPEAFRRDLRVRECVREGQKKEGDSCQRGCRAEQRHR